MGPRWNCEFDWFDCVLRFSCWIFHCSTFVHRGNRVGDAPYVSVGSCSSGTTAATTTDTAATTITTASATTPATTTSAVTTTTAGTTTTTATTTTTVSATPSPPTVCP
ncbi:hypothetical protein P879_11904 [Paragonimus westermani]|uniref:Uncharacterized protein n=1 Tax=Paragonimus westermani TaxID=34504 RepID=A0A8T0D7G4_9TREM|nr:hypothetical protein P879_11904 [Paragonimus westermani]